MKYLHDLLVRESDNSYTDPQFHNDSPNKPLYLSGFAVIIILFFAGMFNATRSVEAATTPLASYSFDASSGTSLVDQSGTNTGTLMNGPTWVAGKNGNALSFDG